MPFATVVENPVDSKSADKNLVDFTGMNSNRDDN